LILEALIRYQQTQLQRPLLLLHASVLTAAANDPSLTSAISIGIAVSYLAPKWPYTVDSYVSLDGGPRVLVDMTALGTPNVDGHETVQSAALWSANGLENIVHHVVVTLGPSGYAVVDGFQ
jgi:hypothetical protein